MSTPALATATTERSLPKGWRWVRLATVINDAQPGFACGERDPHGTVQIRMNNVDTDGSWVWNQLTRVPTNSGTVRQFKVEAGDVLFNNTNSTELVGKSAVFTVFSEPVVYSNHFTRLRAKSGELDNRFLGSWLRLLWTERVFERICNRWIGQSAVKADKLLSLEIPLPPVSEQRRLSDFLETSFEAIQRARAAAEAQLEAATSITAATLRSIFGSSEAREWQRSTLGEVSSIVAPLVDPKLPEYRDLPHINGENIEAGMCRLLYLNTAAEERMTSGKYLFRAGDVLYSKLRPYLRKVVVAEYEGLCSADMYPLKVNTEVLDPQFAGWLLLSDEFTRYADGESRRARMPKLNREQLFAYKVPLPTLDVQRGVARSIAARVETEVRLRAQINEELAALAKLPTALLRRAFKGEL